ncbi:MAG: DUF1667 domain-containing protein [Candidatus Lokiarchaeota archaeon]|nr:DUF1667 domain-containing protein [Candidatus Lokiarchaeota archaeon]
MSEVVDEKFITCIGCPKGCQITVKKFASGEIEAEDYFCKRGEKYAIQEYKNPTRILTTTVKVEGGQLPLIPVRSSEPIPKGKLIDCMKVIAKKSVKAPIEMGDVLIPNILDLNIDIVASRNLE